MSQRFAANQALQLLQSIALESSDGEYSDSESDKVNNVIVDIQNEEDYFDLENKYINQEAPTNTDDCARARGSNDNDEQTLLGKNGFHWRRSVSTKVIAGRLQQQDIVRIPAGPTSYSTSRIIRGNPLSSFRIFFNEPMVKNI